MITVAEAQAIILDNAGQLGDERIALGAALGRTLRQAVTASRPQPPFDASAMDGYAVRSADTPGVLRVIGEAGAGRAFHRVVQGGEAARIFTGAPLPEGADAVLIQEDACRDGDWVTAPKVAAQRNVRRAGIDFERGALLLAPGRILDGGAVAVAAAAGHAELLVAQPPRVAILAGGNEIVAPGTAPGADQIFDSASYGVAAFAEIWGASPRTGPPFMDEEAVIAQRVGAALREADIVVIIGGASVGDHDHAKPAVRALGAEIFFEKVSLRPGKPTWFARCNDQLILGLPGNPTSAFVCARLFLRPLIDRMLGRDLAETCQPVRVRVRTPLPANGARESYVRASVQPDRDGQLWADVPHNQDSSLTSVFASANSLIIREPGAAQAGVGDAVDTLRI